MHMHTERDGEKERKRERERERENMNEDTEQDRKIRQYTKLVLKNTKDNGTNLIYCFISRYLLCIPLLNGMIT